MSAIPPNLPPHLADDYLFSRDSHVYDRAIVRYFQYKKEKDKNISPTADKIPQLPQAQ